MTFFRAASFALVLAWAVGSMACQKVIGDSCSLSSDCSLSGDRQCDTTQTDGYCTVQNCDPNTCPDEALCVAFDAHSPRLRRRYCMAACNADDDCRSGYRCQRPDPPECTMSTADGGTLKAGYTCNVVADRGTPSAAGWCVQNTSCSAGTCGSGVCVVFDANNAARSRATCMNRCVADTDCHSPGYTCHFPNNTTTRVADVLPGVRLGWCAPASVSP
jgi:hypothetical protein